MVLTRLLLCEGDVGVHQTPGDAAQNKHNKNLMDASKTRSKCVFYLMFRPEKLVQVNM